MFNYIHHGGYVCLSVCWLAGLQKDYRTDGTWGGEGHDPRKNQLNLIADPHKGADPGIVFHFL